MQRHAQQDEHEQHDAHPEAFRRQAQGGQPGEHLPRTGAVQLAVPACCTQQHNGGQDQIFELLPGPHQFFRQAEHLFAVQQLFLRKARQPVDKIAQAAKGAHIAAEKTAEQDREPAQAQQRQREAVQLQHAAGPDAQEQLPHPGKPGHERARHRGKEQRLDSGSQPCPLVQGALPLLCRGQRLLLGRFHHAAAFPSASATASMRPSAVRVAPATASTSVDCAVSISSSTAMACL